ncbi:uncharacterized protein IWZ02DRAFT_496973 [Phyllosticta citriasiana]|uniref:uncharacterized protein n=1 Tax=Phyllosticta citriasiana TaxID=595635 RepID=UPI0030FD8AE3
MVSIPLEELPKSLRDAIVVCNRLGIRYLWINSLCVVQSKDGDKFNADWLEHARTMAEIYKNCVLNIAIDRAANPHEGKFVERDPRSLGPCFALWVDLNYYKRPHAIGGIAPKQEDFSQILTCSDTLNRQDGMPPSRRAWAFQEMFLAPRVSFILALIAYSGNVDPSVANAFAAKGNKRIPRNFRDRGDIRYNWSNLLEMHSGRELPRPESERLVALAAVAQSRQDDSTTRAQYDIFNIS